MKELLENAQNSKNKSGNKKMKKITVINCEVGGAL